MSKFSFEDWHNMSEMEQIKHEEEFVHSAFTNSYHLLVEGKKIEDVVKIEDPESLVFMHDVTSKPTKNEVENLMTYFAEQDDFEKCIKLRDKFIKNK